MAISLGSPPQSNFHQPIGLLGDCHRRIERFLNVLVRICREDRGGPLDASRREALEASLRYFKNAAPWHTQDEEVSLFPRLRRLRDDRVATVLAEIDRLESDHELAGRLHHEVDDLGWRWLDGGKLASAHSERLEELLDSLAAIYARHIAFEDQVVFPMAQGSLSSPSLIAMGREMANRRGVDPGLPSRRCKHRKSAPETKPAPIQPDAKTRGSGVPG